MENLTGFQRDLMYVILDNDQPSGQEIRRNMEEYYDSSNVNHGRLYPNLDTLVEEDIIVKGAKDQRTNYYDMTEKGESFIQDRRAWEDRKISSSDIESTIAMSD